MEKNKEVLLQLLSFVLRGGRGFWCLSCSDVRSGHQNTAPLDMSKGASLQTYDPPQDYSASSLLSKRIWVSDSTMEQMPMWCPPTPPQQDSDVYIDQTMSFLYDVNIMSESQLPSDLH
ncbi:hypothetical protein NQ317_013926 [Molorchus minor]|uniref:Uncharacterized protein n=1 Tax=Molorchus minor TaxID=1323400 RepID=A0ABQ9K5Z3_9CUCU|nr:hypothetical protein NQ317_013926 [Molorchus minor]